MLDLNPVTEFRPFRASIGRKQVMALTGLLMCGFLLVHLAGNFLLFRGSEVFNQYAHLMLNNPIIAALEWVLLVLFAIHVGFGLVLIKENRQARPVTYAVRSTAARGANLSFVSMAVTGPLLLIFLLIHLFDFRFGVEHLVNQGGMEIRDLYRSVLDYYQSFWGVAFYIIAMLTLALHVQHGFWSAFQTFGINHPRYNAVIVLCANLYALLVSVGFIAIPLYFFLYGE